jgi:hypothetical protein
VCELEVLGTDDMAHQVAPVDGPGHLALRFNRE